MLQSEESLQEQESNTDNRIIHFACRPCRKKMCGQPMNDTPPTGREVDCIVCCELWENLRCCPYCGGDSHVMWGDTGESKVD